MSITVKSKKPRLGRGLSSLIEMNPEPISVSELTEIVDGNEVAQARSGETILLRVGEISHNPYQPRRTFREESLRELAESIRNDGLMQPVIVRPLPGGGHQLVAGERRWRAAKLAGLHAIPAVVRELTDKQAAEWALIENLQREDLDVIEQAHAFNQLVEKFGLTHEQVAVRIGISRVAVTNRLRLLQLPEAVQEFVRHGQLSESHVKYLLATEIDADLRAQLATDAVKEGWTLRKLESVIRELTGVAAVPGRTRKGDQSAHMKDLALQISEQLGTRVRVQPGVKKNSGKLIIEYYGLVQFDSLMEKLGVSIG